MEEKQLKIDFSYTDEFGQESRMVKTFDPCVLEVSDTLNFLVDEFKLFLFSQGFSRGLVKKVITNYNNDEE